MHLRNLLVILAVVLAIGAGGIEPIRSQENSSPRSTTAPPSEPPQRANQNRGDPSRQPDPQRISDYIRTIFQDSRGHLWFGTNGDGVCRYDGESLEYFAINEGFGGWAVRGIVEDGKGNVWFATNGGVTRFDGATFCNLTEHDGLLHNDCWCIAVDRHGEIWIGTLQGACRFDGNGFSSFPIPEAEPDPSRGVSSAKIVHCIMEDRQGKMWFGTNGGAYIYDGTSLSNLSEKDGLPSNSVNGLLEDNQGEIWFATHDKGICRWNGTAFTRVKPGNGTKAWKLFEDRSGHIWFPLQRDGVYRYDGKTFTHFYRSHGLASDGIQCIHEDREGRVWLGGVFGLFRYDGKSIQRVGKHGPWAP